MNFEKKHILVFGLARSGLAAIDLLLSKEAVITGVDAKSNDALKKKLDEYEQKGVNIIIGDDSMQNIEGVDIVVISPGIPMSHPLIVEAIIRKIPIIGELELAFNCFDGQTIAVTGTNGKSTTTALINHILHKAGVNSVEAGNIGVPFSSVVDEGKKVAVVEVSSYQLETIESFKPHIAVWMNLTEDHLGRHGSLQNYGMIKSKIFYNQSYDDYLIYKQDDIIEEYIKHAKCRHFPFSITGSAGAYVDNGNITINWNNKIESVLPVSELKIRGNHNIENALASTAAVYSFGLKPSDIAEGLRSFIGIEHRQEIVGIYNGITVINDSKATNLDSGLKALETFDPPIILIAGGRGKGEDYTPAGSLIKQKVKNLIAIGEAAGQMIGELSGFAETERVVSLKNAVKKAFALAQPGDTILLSPMCASFDMFSDFEERGRAFKAYVKEIANA